jgi:hypothetical protein
MSRLGFWRKTRKILIRSPLNFRIRRVHRAARMKRVTLGRSVSDNITTIFSMVSGGAFDWYSAISSSTIPNRSILPARPFHDPNHRFVAPRMSSSGSVAAADANRISAFSTLSGSASPNTHCSPGRPISCLHSSSLKAPCFPVGSEAVSLGQRQLPNWAAARASRRTGRPSAFGSREDTGEGYPASRSNVTFRLAEGVAILTRNHSRRPSRDTV